MSAGWGFSEDTKTSSTVGWGFESNTPGSTAPAYSELEVQVVNARNRARRVMTTVPEFTAHLVQSGLDGPHSIVLPGLDKSTWAEKIGAGAQFTVFLDTRRPAKDRVIKRVNVFDTYDDQQRKREGDAHFRRQLYTIETEILALCHPPLRNHRNIITLFAWGYDYREDNNSPAVPILHMEKAQSSLSSFLARVEFVKNNSVSQDILGYQLCLDVAEGLAAMHRCGIVHGDIKPDNILIFPQENQNVPFIAKLSDFGVCVALQGESAPIDFTAYRGTPGWRPPEAVRYTEEIHGPFSPELLLRSDSFSYGLLVLSVLVTGGHPPLSKSLETVGQAALSLNSFFTNSVSILPLATASGPTLNPLDDALEVLSRGTNLRATLRAKVRSLLTRVLQVRPENRDLVDSEMLADDDEGGYLNWRHQKNKFPSTSHPLDRNQTWRRGIKYWLNPEQGQLRELDQQYDNLIKRGEDPRFPGEVLHGMAIAYLSNTIKMNLHQGKLDRALMYMVASAAGGFSVAQGICERLHSGLGRTLPENIDKATRSQWLYNAASTGSLLASEMLSQSDRSLYESACAEFRKNGGYNDGHTRTIKTQLHLLEERHLVDILSGKDINNYVVDIGGNRLLHLASMVGDVNATQSLLSLEGTEVNVKNDTGETPLLLACKAGHAEIVKLLVDSGADASITPYDLFSIGPLYWLFNFEADEIPNIGRILVQKAKAPINNRITPTKIKNISGPGEVCHYGQIQAWHFPFEWPYGTALHWATFSRSYAAIDILCEMGIDVDALDLESSEFAQTALSLAANHVDPEMVEYLLKKGASATKANLKNRGPLHFLSEDIGFWNRGLMGWRGLRDWILCGTSAEHRLKVDRIVKLLLEAGCDLEGAAIWGKDTVLTPLAYATARRIPVDTNVTLSLVGSGAKIDVPISTRRSLLQEWAVADPRTLAYPDVYISVLKTLIIKSGIKVLETRDPLGHTFLACIARNETLSFQTLYQVVEFYKASGYPLDLNSRSNKGHTAFHIALSRYRSNFRKAPLIRLVEVFYQWGADLTTVSNEQLNALHMLGQNDWLDDHLALECLQFYKKNVPSQHFIKMIDQQDKDGHTPLMFMAKSAKTECVKWLIGEGVNTDVLCTGWMDRHWTALDFVLNEAERYRHWFLVEVRTFDALRDGVHNYTLKAESRSDDLKGSSYQN